MKVPKQLALERKMRVWELRQRGYTYELIAKELSISNMAVCKILQRLTKAYTQRHLEDVDRIKAEQVAELEQVGFEAYQAWERSKEVAKLIRQKKAVAASGETLGVSEQTLESRDQDGDPRYLQVYMKAKEDIRKIIGADAPTKTEIKHSDYEKMSDEELTQEFKKVYGEIHSTENDQPPLSEGFDQK